MWLMATIWDSGAIGKGICVRTKVKSKNEITINTSLGI